MAKVVAMNVPDNYQMIVVPTSSLGVAFLVCKTCGCLVVDTEPHDEYHSRSFGVEYTNPRMPELPKSN